MGENAYMSVCDRQMHVSLFASFKRALALYGAGGSKTGCGSSRTKINIAFTQIYNTYVYTCIHYIIYINTESSHRIRHICYHRGASAICYVVCNVAFHERLISIVEI